MKEILVIEADPIIMNLIVTLLEREGYQVIQCPAAEGCIEAAGRHAPDLVRMDVAPPGMDDLAAIRILKAMEETRRVPVIALTAQNMKQNGEKAVRAGCDGFIVKPPSPLVFLTEVACLLYGEARAGRG